MLTGVLVRFDLITGPNKDQFENVGRFRMGAVPSPGEVISIAGNPYVIVERGWAVSDEDTYAYIRVSKFTPF